MEPCLSVDPRSSGRASHSIHVCIARLARGCARQRRVGIGVAAMLLSLQPLALCLVFALTAGAEDWRMYLHDLAHSSFNDAESLIDPGNAGTLSQAWKLSLGKPLAAAPTVLN